MDLSIVIATRDRAALVESTLRSLARQNATDLAWEVVVVDNASVDRTPQVLQAATASIPLVALAEPKPGKNRAMNRGLAAARGRLLLFSDDDVIAEASWIAEMAAAARRWPADDVFGGEVQLVFPDGTPGWLQEPFDPALNFARYGANEAEGPTVRLPTGPNFAVRARALSNVRFSESIGPDGTGGYAMGSETELLERLRARGARFIYVPSAVVHHIVQPHQLQTKYLLGRSFRLARGEVRRSAGRRPVAARLFGAPRHLWREAAAAGLSCAASGIMGRRRRLAAALRLARVCGLITEHRAMAGAGTPA